MIGHTKVVSEVPESALGDARRGLSAEAETQGLSSLCPGCTSSGSTATVPVPDQEYAQPHVATSAHVAFVLLPMFLAVGSKPGALHLRLACWFGLWLPRLLNLMYECAHLHVLKRREGSEWLDFWALAPLMGEA